MTDREEIKSGNIIISRWLYGESDSSNLFQIGYKDRSPWFRTANGICDDDLENFHTSWNLLMTAINKIAKVPIIEYSQEEILADQIKNSLFQYSYDPLVTWFIIVRYVKLKMAV